MRKSPSSAGRRTWRGRGGVASSGGEGPRTYPSPRYRSPRCFPTPRRTLGSKVGSGSCKLGRSRQSPPVAELQSSRIIEVNDEDSSQSVSQVQSGILESRTLFVDTSEFERLAYAFGAGTLEILSTHDRVTLLLPEVVESEIRDHLQKAAHESVWLHKSFSDKVRVIRNLGDPRIAPVFTKFDADEVTKALIVSFEKFTSTILRSGFLYRQLIRKWYSIAMWQRARLLALERRRTNSRMRSH